MSNLVCPYRGNEKKDTDLGCCGESSAHFITECSCCGATGNLVPDPRDCEQEFMVCESCEYEIEQRATHYSEMRGELLCL